MKYALRVTRSAWKDVDEQLEWMRDTASLAAAVRWYEAWWAKVATLERMPNARAIAQENRVIRGEVVRQLVAVGFRTLFLVRDEIVYVLHVRRASRRPTSRAEMRARLDDLLGEA